MDYISIFAIAVSLAMDAFSVSIVCGLIIDSPGLRHYFRLSFHFGLFQFFMPILGFLIGRKIENIIKDYDHWIAFILLLFIGLKMINDSRSKDESNECSDPSKGFSLVYLSLATSIDAFAVGLSLGLLGNPILLPSVIIGIVCAIFSAIGVYLGDRIGIILGKRIEALGGIILIIIGIKIVIEHLWY